jgi:predicted HTH transcriptional regulator
MSHSKGKRLEDVQNEKTSRIEKDTVKIQDSPFAHIDEKPTVQKSIISTVTALDIGARRKKILEVVKSKGQATIHEFIQSIQGCSSKTIQRELTSLVLSGTLKKTGERRWSKYSMR